MKGTAILCLSILMVLSGCAPKLIQTRVGVRPGLTISTYDRKDGFEKYSGTGVMMGVGMGSDFFGLLGLDMTPQYRSTNQARDSLNLKTTNKYQNLYFPITLSLKGGMIPLVSPYVSAGIGINVPVSYVKRYEQSGTAWEISGSAGVSAFVILGLGAELKLLKLRIVPEFMSNLQARDESDSTQAIDYHISVGVYYAP